jgi:iron complex outermembrane receptor protein
MIRQVTIAALLLVALASAASVAALDKSTGGVKGKVRSEDDKPLAGVTVIALQGEREVARTTTDRKGDFTLTNLAPGLYTLRFSKPGLRLGTMNNVEVKAGKDRQLPKNLFLPVDEGSLVFVRGSVFTPEGRSVPGAHVELARVGPDGSVKKLDSRVTNDSGEFVFRLAPSGTTTYRVTAKIDGAEPATKDVEVDSPAIYRIALTLPPTSR